MKIAVFGAGYVGCITAASLASKGHSVWLVESAESKLSLLQRGQSPIVEPGIEPLLPDLIRKGAIQPIGRPEEAVAQTDLALICVGTPSLADGTTDIRQVQSVFQQITAALKNRREAYTVTLRSTVPYPLLKSPLLSVFQQGLPGRYGKDLFFALNPEFLREGSAMDDFVHPPFVVVGSDHPKAVEQLKRLYQDIQAPFHVLSLGSASLLKYACNAFHALKITFTNEISSLSSLFEADAKEVMGLFCQDKILNISPTYLRPGFAYGGSCLPKDLKTLNRLSEAAAIPTPVLQTIEKSNGWVIEKTVQSISDFGVRKIGLVGLTFKAGTDDFRNSPLVEIAERLLGKGFELTVYDPDIDVRKIHGQNLRYIEQRMRHLAQLLTADFSDLVGRAELVVIGKPFSGLPDDLKKVPSDRFILDLTRQLPGRSQKPPIFHLETIVQTRRDPVSS